MAKMTFEMNKRKSQEAELRIRKEFERNAKLAYGVTNILNREEAARLIQKSTCFLM